MRVWRADLHVHTCLSPCADLSMAPRTIVAKAVERGLDAIGIADHNSAGNVPAVMGAARHSGLTVLP
ncbi:MAG: PHP domain-containing protein, partial [Bryobacteraceae bacterium]